MKRIILLIYFLLLTMLPPPFHSAFGEEVSGESLSAVSEQVEEIRGVLGRTRIGGWVDFVYKDTDQKDFKQFFDLHHFYLYFDNKLNEYWQAFGEVEYEHIPNLRKNGGSGRLKIERGYIQFSPRDYMKFRFGKFNTPLGIWTPEHWAIYVDTITKPIHEENVYVPSKSVGLEFLGSILIRLGGDMSTFFNYKAYLSNGPEIFGTNEPVDNQLGGGIDLSLDINDKYRLGVSGYFQHNPSPSLAGTAGRREGSGMAYFDLGFPHGILIRGELFYQGRGDGDPSVTAYYGKVKWSFNDKWYINYRWNRGDDEKEGNGKRETVNTVTLSYWPILEVRMKAELSNHSFESPIVEGYNAWMFWLGYIF
jgi:hypothetical protein